MEQLLRRGADPLAESAVRAPGRAQEGAPDSPLANPLANPPAVLSLLLIPGLLAPPTAPPQDGSTPLEVASPDWPEVRAALLEAAEARIRRGAAAEGSDFAAALLGMRERGVGLDVTLRCASAGGGNGEEAAAAASSVRCHSAALIAQGDFWRTLVFGPMARCGYPRPRQVNER